ncbi:malto-oligosyltrehalose synthase [Chloroflexota bacterium]
MAVIKIPIATYRIQFNGQFTFNDARLLVPYLKELGISDVYASPILKARRGSTHGYNVVDPTKLNPELGTEEDFDALVTSLKDNNMGLLADIVPNHMAASSENSWWQDINNRGKESPYWGYFDMDWLSFGGEVKSLAGHRRFFDIGELAGVRVEDETVFKATHSFIMSLIRENKVTGLRIDHIDGLYNPEEYLKRLQDQINQPETDTGFYLVVEKIISGDESLPQDWPVSGTTGYEFADALNRFFMNSEGMQSLDRIYRDFTDRRDAFTVIIYEKKKMVMTELFSREMEALGRCLENLARESGQELSFEAARSALTEVTARLPVYRTYITDDDISPADRLVLEGIVKETDRSGVFANPTLDFLRRVLLMDFTSELSEKQKQGRLQFVMRWQQLTGAIMAKGNEDTALYNYSRLISLNEVGGIPDTGGMSMDEFHRFNMDRNRHWPDTLNATSTHDTKRSEDVRARISVLSEMPDEWEKRLGFWRKLNESKKTLVKGQAAPEPETEIFIYQTLLGAWPLSEAEKPEFNDRIKTYLIKAMREAKGRTNWLKPNEEYEEGVLSFIQRLTDTNGQNAFLDDFIDFENTISHYGMPNSLAQTLLKITLPGVPDFYRGTELWDFSLVDPDNRRPVDFKQRTVLLEEIIRLESLGTPELLRQILTSQRDGRIKLFLIWRALNMRLGHPELFQRGEYIPVDITGGMSENICAFIRQWGDRYALTVAPRFFTRITAPGKMVPDKSKLADVALVLPDDMPRDWQDVFTGRRLKVPPSLRLGLNTVLDSFPVALLQGV